MKMRSISRFFMGMLAVCTIAACSDDLGNGSNVNPDTSKDAVYMNVTVQLPVGPGTRSATNPGGGSEHGTEIGKDYENKVNSVLLVLADKDYGLIGCAEKTESLAEKDGTITAVQSISKSVLSAYYGGDNGTLTNGNNQIHVFVFCNPTSTLRGVFNSTMTETTQRDKTWYDKVCTITEDPNGNSDNATIWGGPDHLGGFLMSSYEISKKQIPTNFSSWEKFTTKDSPFKLSDNNPNVEGEGEGIDNSVNGGAIKVERSVARFDFKDGSTLGNNTYNVVKDPENNDNYIMQIQLTKMALVNMSKNFYYLRRVSKDGLHKADDNEFKLCGIETSTNYVVDTDATEKQNKTIITNNTYKDHFNFCLGNQPLGEEWRIDIQARNQWFSSLISNVLKGTADEDETWNNGTNNNNEKPGNDTGDRKDYKIWRYVTENTIPYGPDKQENGISTGVVFKGKMIAPEGSTGTLATTLNGNLVGDGKADPILYVFGNEIFVTWKEVRKVAIARSTGDPLYIAAFGNTKQTPVAEKTAGEDGTGAVTPVYSDDKESPDYLWSEWDKVDKKEGNELNAFKQAAAKRAGFTLYQSSSDDGTPGYYCYYFYWNRHNDNGNNGVMGTMEFGVVRNNVYKLAVTNIRKLGHPRISENDPDPVDPEDPDEDGDVYLSVSVEVLPWVVRINNIEF